MEFEVISRIPDIGALISVPIGRTADQIAANLTDSRLDDHLKHTGASGGLGERIRMLAGVAGMLE
jgi:hypothetical protein